MGPCHVVVASVSVIYGMVAVLRQPAYRDYLLTLNLDKPSENQHIITPSISHQNIARRRYGRARPTLATPAAYMYPFPHKPNARITPAYIAI